MILYQALDRAVARAAEDESAALQARRRWGELAGEVHDDEPLYEERATAFLEWLALDHVSAPHGLSAVVSLLRSADTEARPALAALAAGHRSIFLVQHPVHDGLVVEDLWGGALFHVHERRQLTGMDPGELFEARLVADPESPPHLLFTRALCFHPREALSSVRTLVARNRQAGASREDLCFRLLRLRVRWERYRHVSPARVYLTDTRD